MSDAALHRKQTYRRGLIAEYGLAWLLPRIVGVTHAADILLTGRVLRSQEMLRMGVLNDVFEAENFLERVLEIARSMATNVSPAAAAVSTLGKSRALSAPPTAPGRAKYWSLHSTKSLAVQPPAASPTKPSTKASPKNRLL